jgi:hypothetical protein
MFNAFVERLSTTVPAGQHRDAFIAYAQGKIMRLAEELAEDANYARSCANMPPEEREGARRMLAAFMGATVSLPDGLLADTPEELQHRTDAADAMFRE